MRFALMPSPASPEVSNLRTPSSVASFPAVVLNMSALTHRPLTGTGIDPQLLRITDRVTAAVRAYAAEDSRRQARAAPFKSAVVEDCCVSLKHGRSPPEHVPEATTKEQRLGIGGAHVIDVVAERVTASVRPSRVVHARLGLSVPDAAIR